MTAFVAAFALRSPTSAATRVLNVCKSISGLLICGQVAIRVAGLLKQALQEI